jgi:hypothetical protein
MKSLIVKAAPPPVASATAAATASALPAKAAEAQCCAKVSKMVAGCHD